MLSRCTISSGNSFWSTAHCLGLIHIDTLRRSSVLSYTAVPGDLYFIPNLSGLKPWIRSYVLLLCCVCLSPVSPQTQQAYAKCGAVFTVTPSVQSTQPTITVMTSSMSKTDSSTTANLISTPYTEGSNTSRGFNSTSPPSSEGQTKPVTPTSAGYASHMSST
ncbi:hypothetical protein NFI96_019601, partial [Prochilodus magdalenae]